MTTSNVTVEFFDNVVKPTVDEYLARPEDIRRGRLAAIVLNHMVDYWCVDTLEKKEATHAALRTDTPIPNHPGYWSVGIIRDLADASKHANLERKSRTLTNAEQVEQHFIVVYGTAPYGTVAFGTQAPNDVQVTLDDGKSFILSYVIRRVMEVWDQKQESFRAGPQALT